MVSIFIQWCYRIFFIVCFCFFINDNPANSLSMGDVSQGNIRHTKLESEYSITK